MKFKTVIEPFRIKVVEPIKRLSRKERQLALEKAQFNLFKLKSEDVLIDLLTDSGTSAMSSDQWAELMRGDESYAGSRSFYALKTAVQNQMNYKHIFPVHQGRAAERILFQIVGGEGKVIPNNTHFDTTRANCEYSGAKAIDLCDDRDEIFKGNMDLAALKKVLSTEDVPLVMMTITNNSRGGHPVSMENMEKAYELAKSFGVPVFLDCARFAENAYWIKKHEKGFSEKSVFEIAREMFSYSDGCTMSAKKDAFANMGGLLCCNEDALSEKIQNLEILTEGFPTYGGLSGRDLACLAQGLKEIVDEDYLEYRYASAHYFARKLRELGVPVLEPVGLHALYVDAGKCFLIFLVMNFLLRHFVMLFILKEAFEV